MGEQGEPLTKTAGFSQPAAYLAAIVESSDDAIISKNMDGIITSWNGGAERMLGYTAEEAIGQPGTLIIPPDRLQEEEDIMATLRQGGHINNLETVRIAKDGHLVNLSLSISPIRNPEGKIVGISKTGRDISKRSEQLEIQIKKLEKANEALKDLTNIAAHDLKEPLRGINMKASILLNDYQGKLDQQIIKELQDLARLSKRSSRLIEDLLNISRIGKDHVIPEDVDLNEIIGDIMRLMEDRLKEKNARINVSRPLPHFSGNKKGVTEVIRNLVTNAIIYNDKPQPVVEIGYIEEMDSTPHGPKQNVFYVRDNGIGIPPEFHEHIFRLFKQSPSSKKYNPDSTGLGLALVKKIIDECKGDIWLESEVGKGTTFYFTVGECVEMKGQ